MAESSVSYKCPKCGAPLSFQPGRDTVSCEYCGTEFEIVEADPRRVKRVRLRLPRAVSARAAADEAAAPDS